MNAPQVLQPFIKAKLTQADATDLLAMARFAIRTKTTSVLSLIEQAPMYQAQFSGIDEESDAFLNSHWDLDAWQKVAQWAKEYC